VKLVWLAMAGGLDDPEAAVRAPEFGAADGTGGLDATLREADGGRLRSRRFGAEDVLPGGACTVTGGSVIELAGGGELSPALDCAFAAASKPSGTTETTSINPTNRRDTLRYPFHSGGAVRKTSTPTGIGLYVDGPLPNAKNARFAPV
jgi:hypothetical protein